MKVKSSLLLLLAAVVVITGALLPRIFANTQDGRQLDQLTFSQINNVQLEFVEDGISMRETLGILCRNTDAIEVPLDLAAHTKEDILLIASQFISHYQNAGLILHNVDVKTHLADCVPQLQYEDNSNRKSNIFWVLRLMSVQENWEMYLTIDDKSGKLCNISYDYYMDPDYVVEGYSSPAEPIYSDLYDTLLTFSALFLKDLGDEFSDFDIGQLEQGTSTSIDEEFISSSVEWDDSISGKCHIIFYVMDTKFYTLLY